MGILVFPVILLSRTISQGCDVLSHVSGRTKRTNPIWICIWFGHTSFAIFPYWYCIFVSVRTQRTNLIWFCIWFGDPKHLHRSQPCRSPCGVWSHFSPLFGFVSERERRGSSALSPQECQTDGLCSSLPASLRENAATVTLHVYKNAGCLSSKFVLQ